MSGALFSALDAEFENFPILAAGPAREQEIDEIEAYAGFLLPVCYRGFVARYGGAIVGSYSVYGAGASPAMGRSEDSAIKVTERFRAQGWPGTELNLVISMDHAGNAITLDENGRAYRYDHDSGVTEELAATLEEFILRWCLNR